MSVALTRCCWLLSTDYSNPNCLGRNHEIPSQAPTAFDRTVLFKWSKSISVVTGPWPISSSSVWVLHVKHSHLTSHINRQPTRSQRKISGPRSLNVPLSIIHILSLYQWTWRPSPKHGLILPLLMLTHIPLWPNYILKDTSEYLSLDWIIPIVYTSTVVNTCTQLHTSRFARN